MNEEAKICPMMSTMVPGCGDRALEAPCIGSRCALWVEKYEGCNCDRYSGECECGRVDISHCGLRGDK